MHIQSRQLTGCVCSARAARRGWLRHGSLGGRAALLLFAWVHIAERLSLDRVAVRRVRWRRVDRKDRSRGVSHRRHVRDIMRDAVDGGRPAVMIINPELFE